MILPLCAALITISDNSCYFIVNFFLEMEVVSCSSIAGMLLCFVVLSGICVSCVG